MQPEKVNAPMLIKESGRIILSSLEQLRKELQKKREIAKSKIKEIKKHDPNRKKKKIIILGLNDKKSEKNSNINLEPDEESNEKEENFEEDSDRS